MYNGRIAYEKGLEKVEDTYNDDFTEILPIEPFSFYAEERLDDDEQPIGQSDFERSEDKAVKSIQKHSMLIGGFEKNPQIDEAYLLLGKSRYYTKRFTPALESFQYIIKNYPTASLIYETVVWRSKANIHTGNVDFGKKSLLRLLTSSRLSKEVRQQSELGVVMAYEKTPDSLEQMIVHLEASLMAVNKGIKASRAAFVLGQLYRKKGDIIASDSAFTRVINTKKGLYKYKLQAKIEKINNHVEDYSTEAFIAQIDHLIFVRKNRAYVNKLLFTKGLVYEKADSIKLAKHFYTQSIERSMNDIGQKMITYEQLGDMAYGQKKYLPAKFYYDSLIDVSKNKNSKRVSRIKRKSSSLEKIVTTIEAAKANDSLLKIGSMKDADLKVFFQNYIERLKEREKRKRIKELKLLAAQNKLESSGGEGNWYFYNNKLRVEGKEEFKTTWKLLQKNSNWYAASLFNSTSTTEEKEVVEDSVQTTSLNKYKIEFYINQVNKTPEFLDSIAKSRDLNYYVLGNAYYSQLGEKYLAIEKLEKLLEFNPSDNLKLGSYYRLYKIYKETEEEKKANIYLKKLQVEFPRSSFTKLASNSKLDSISDEEKEDYITCYETIYELYQLDSYDAALEEVESAMLKYDATTLAPKYALLHAYILAKIKGKKVFYKLLEEVVLRYPNTEEALKATEILNKK